MEWYIGIDSGGSKTAAILADASGCVLRACTASGANPLDVGQEETCRIVLSCVEKLMHKLDKQNLRSIYAGIAGSNHVDLGLEQLLGQHYPAATIRIEDDRRIVLSGTMGHTNGCGLICGTGSSLSIILENQPIRQVGGLGYLIDTGGSGYELGRSALHAAFRYLDGRDGYTVLADKIKKAIGCDLWKGMSEIYRGGRPFIASLAHTVFEGAREGDAASCKIMEDQAWRLSELTFVAERYFEGNFPVVMTGGIFHGYPEYVNLVRQKASPRAQMIVATEPPVYGALVEAMYQAGLKADESMKENFKKSYEEIDKRKEMIS